MDPPRACGSPGWYRSNFWLICDEFYRFVARFPDNLVLLQPFVLNVFDDDGVHFQKLAVSCDFFMVSANTGSAE